MSGQKQYNQHNVSLKNKRAHKTHSKTWKYHHNTLFVNIEIYRFSGRISPSYDLWLYFSLSLLFVSRKDFFDFVLRCFVD